MAYVFISHSKKDADVVRQLCEILEQNGIECWFAPRNIIAGTDWAAAITQAINECSVFLLVYSQNSATSNQVPRELSMAGGRGIQILPYRIDDTRISDTFEYYMSECHWIKANPAAKDFKERELIAAIENLAGEKTAILTRMPKAQNNHSMNPVSDNTTIPTTVAGGSAQTNKKFVVAGVVAVLVFVCIFFTIWIATAKDIMVSDGREAVSAKDYTALAREYYEKEHFADAFYYANLAAGADDAEGLYWLGMCYYEGNGTGKDYEKAVEWMEKSADRGYTHAMHVLGDWYYNGTDDIKDYKKAVEWYQKAFDNGDKGAKEKLDKALANPF